MPKKSWSKSFERAIDVSPAFDNCFFHCYAVHLFANNLPLPADLFTFKSLLGNKSAASKLQAQFPDQNSLSLFENYAKITFPNAKLASPSCIMEKTLVVGFLMREWFASKMAMHVKIRDNLQSTIVDAAIGYKNARTGAESGMKTAHEQLLSGGEGVFYTANKAFLEYFTERPLARELTSVEEGFEQYFNNQPGITNEQAIEAYWQAQGFQLYCKEIAKPATKLAYQDVADLMEEVLKQPLTIYPSRPSPEKFWLHNGKGSELIPGMQIILQAQAGHYKLLRLGKNKALLNEYAASAAQYKLDKTKSLEINSNSFTEKTRAAQATSSLLVAATFPEGMLPNGIEAFSLLLDRVNSLKDAVSEYQVKHAKELEAQRHTDELAILKKKIAPLKKEFEDKVKKLEKKLFKFTYNSSSYEAADKLCTSLTAAGEKYFNNISPGTYRVFQEECKNQLKAASSILGSHRGWGKLVASILVVVASLGLALGLDLAMNRGKLTLFSTDTSIQMKDLEKQLTTLSPTPNVGG